MKAQVNEIKERLKHCEDSEILYKIPFIGVLVTEGIKYLSETQEYFEIFMDMCLISRKFTNGTNKIVIDFKRLSEEKQDFTGYEVEIIYSDGNDNILKKQGYIATDFPLDELRLFFVNDTLMLPSEY